MSREELITNTIEKLHQLSDSRIQEVSDYVNFLASKIDVKIISEEIKTLASTSKSYEFLHSEEELYQVSDVKEKFNYESAINEFSLTEEMKNLLDERRATSKTENFIPWNEAKKQFRFKSER